MLFSLDIILERQVDREGLRRGRMYPPGKGRKNLKVTKVRIKINQLCILHIALTINCFHLQSQNLCNVCKTVLRAADFDHDAPWIDRVETLRFKTSKS